MEGVVEYKDPNKTYFVHIVSNEFMSINGIAEHTLINQQKCNNYTYQYQHGKRRKHRFKSNKISKAYPNESNK